MSHGLWTPRPEQVGDKAGAGDALMRAADIISSVLSELDQGMDKEEVHQREISGTEVIQASGLLVAGAACLTRASIYRARENAGNL